MILVTGAAGAIGRATVRAFRAAGYPVVGFDSDPAVVEAVEQEDYAGYVVDVRDEKAVAQAVRAAQKRGPLHHVIGIAGGALPDEPPTQDDPVRLEPDVFRASLELNLISQFVVLRAALPWLRDAGGDRSIILTSSWNALTGCGMPAYSAAKAGLVGMMHALTAPLGAEGIRVNVVAPGTVRTPRTERIWAHDAGHWGRLEAGTALGRLGTPDDVASTYLALAIHLTHVTGQVLVVDGGQMVKR
ncbi:MAG TPA: SDR family oxidoreductase [Longimicrobium sp.]|nr:SDR family oxidoreductase [Longimicrobium sp.]